MANQTTMLCCGLLREGWEPGTLLVYGSDHPAVLLSKFPGLTQGKLVQVGTHNDDWRTGSPGLGGKR